MAHSDTFAISKTVRHSPLRHTADGLLLERIKDAVLGKHYELSLVFVGDTRSRALNRAYRSKDKPANVLSFPLSHDAGEIFINPHRVEKEASRFDHSPRTFLIFLFIHGLLHLKGHSHGSTMEKTEQRLLKRFLRVS